MASSHKPLEFKTVTLTAGVETPNAAFKIRVTSKLGGKYDVFKVDNFNNATLIDMGAIHGIAGSISGIAFAPSGYGKVSGNPHFQALYGVKNRVLTYVVGGVETPKVVESAPCMICGLVLPMRNMTIDHQRPQTGGEVEAVLKTFRAFGLTVEGPKGGKGQAMMAHVFQGAKLGTVMPQEGRPAAGGASVDNRYTLNEPGAILYSFIAQSGNLAQLKAACLHGLCNLKPACQTCNSSRGQQLKYP